MRTSWKTALAEQFQTAQIKIKSSSENISHSAKKTIQKIVHARLWRKFELAGRRHSRALVKLARQMIKRRQLEPFSGLIMIAAFVVIGNQANQQALAAPAVWESDAAGLSAEQVGQVLTALDPLTPELVEDPERVASALLPSDDTYLSRPELSAMSEAKTLSKKDPIQYTVQKGDTLVSIAQANNRTVATVLEANGIKPEDASKIKPGVTLVIPQEDTSASLAWLQADQKARADAAKIAADKAAKTKAATTKVRNRALAAATTKEESADSFDGNGSAGGFIVPINHNGISRGLGRGHTGIDYRANVGTSVAAGADGRVIEITHGWAGGWGNSILVDHGRGVTSRYAHLSDVGVGIGETVSQGEVIGHSGNTGHSTGPHLHFEVRVNGRPVNPF